jgi:hypothetical protein
MGNLNELDSEIQNLLSLINSLRDELEMLYKHRREVLKECTHPERSLEKTYYPGSYFSTKGSIGTIRK